MTTTALILAATDLVAAVLLSAIYFQRHRRRDLVVAFLGVNVGVLAVATVLGTAEREEVVQVFQLERLSLLWIAQNLVRQELLENLSMVDLFLDCARCYETVNLNLSLLTETPRSLSGLNISRWVPIWVVDDDAISTSEIDTEPTNFGRQQEHM